jgi:hypothetical protein
MWVVIYIYILVALPSAMAKVFGKEYFKKIRFCRVSGLWHGIQVLRKSFFLSSAGVMELDKEFF